MVGDKSSRFFGPASPPARRNYSSFAASLLRELYESSASSGKRLEGRRFLLISQSCAAATALRLAPAVNRRPGYRRGHRRAPMDKRKLRMPTESFRKH
eukprot:5662577-Pyramimonas_sp.AAC.1